MRRRDVARTGELGGFEGRLLVALTDLDQERPAPVASSMATLATGPAAWRRPAVIGGAVAAVLLVGAATATAAQLLSRPTFEIGGAEVVVGETMLLKGSGCRGGSVVVIGLDGVDIGTVTSNRDGTFVAEPTVPEGTAPGPHTVTATCDDGVRHDGTIRAVAQREPIPPFLVVVGPTRAGGSTLIKGAGCRPGSAVVIRTDGDRSGGAAANAEGLYVADLVVPAGMRPGTHTVETTCAGPDGRDLRLTADLTVVPG
jgi:hypothetical protein